MILSEKSATFRDHALVIGDWAISDKGSTPVLQTGGRVSITRWSTNFIPDRPTAGRPAVNRSIVVRVHVGEPIFLEAFLGASANWRGNPPLKREIRDHGPSLLRSPSLTGQSGRLRICQVGVRIAGRSPLKHDPEKFQTFRTRSCSEIRHDPEKLQTFRTGSCSEINEMRARCDSA